MTSAEGWAEPWAFAFDFVLNCSDMTHTFDLKTYMSTLKVGGEFHMVGLPDEPLPEMMAQGFASNAAKLTGSHLGNNRKDDHIIFPAFFSLLPRLVFWSFPFCFVKSRRETNKIAQRR